MSIKDKYKIKDKFNGLYEVSSELNRLDAELGKIMDSMDSLDFVSDREKIVNLEKEGDMLAEAMMPLYELELFLKNNNSEQYETRS